MADVLINQFIERLDKINVKNEHCGQIVESIEKSENKLLTDCWDLGELFTDFKSQLAAPCTYAIREVSARREKINNIREILCSNAIQIVFIGSVSSGKSKVINAIIEEEIFQSSTGATTTHIVKLTASGDERSSLIHKNSERVYYDKRDDLIEEILELSTTLGDRPIGEDNSLDIFLSQPKGRILDSRIKLIDTPGYDSSVKAKSRILEMCQVADIVVFVMTYNFNEAERAMFESLSKKTSKLNMFIMVNKWDESDTDKTDSTEKSRKTIENNLIKWLTKTKELSEESAKSKYFFISAKELMEAVTNEARDATSADHEQKAKLRHEQFEKFIHELKDNIDHPEFTKCRKHEKDIDNIEVKLNEDILQCLKLTKEMMGRRKVSVGTIESIKQNLVANKTKLLNELSFEKSERLELLRNFQNKQSGWFSSTRNWFQKKEQNEEDLLNLDGLVSKFDNELNTLENIEEDNLKQIGMYAISKESSDFRIKTYVTIWTDERESQQSPPPDRNESTLHMQTEGNKVKNNKKPNDKPERKTKYEKNNSASLESSKEDVTANVFEEEMIKTFQEFEDTISRRLDPILQTMEKFLEKIKLSSDELETIHDKETSTNI